MFNRHRSVQRSSTLVGIGGADWIKQQLTNVITYTVPANKVMLVHSVNTSTSGLTIDGVTLIPSGTQWYADKRRMLGSSATCPPAISGSHSFAGAANTYATPTAVGTTTSANVLAETAEYLFALQAGTVLASINNNNCYILGTLYPAQL